MRTDQEMLAYLKAELDAVLEEFRWMALTSQIPDFARPNLDYLAYSALVTKNRNRIKELELKITQGKGF